MATGKESFCKKVVTSWLPTPRWMIPYLCVHEQHKFDSVGTGGETDRDTEREHKEVAVGVGGLGLDMRRVRERR